MYCAYLRNGDIWKRSNNTDQILAHDGEIVICDTREEENDIGLTLSGMEPDRFVQYLDWNQYIVTDHRLFDDLVVEAVESLNESGTILVKRLGGFVHHSHKNRVFYVAGLNCSKSHENIIGEPVDGDSSLMKVTINPELWAIGTKKVNNLRKKRKVAQDTALIKHPDVLSEGYNLCALAGFRAGESNFDNIIAGIILHDELVGVEATNEKIAAMATQFFKFEAENKARFLEKHWLTEAQIDRLTARFKLAIPAVSTEEMPPADQEPTDQEIIDQHTA